MFKQLIVIVAAAAGVTVSTVACADIASSADPALPTWINGALARSPEIQAVQAAVDAASGRSRAASQPLFNPEVELEYESTDTDTTAGELSQTIDWGESPSVDCFRRHC